jgi:hypothetical protein
MYVQQVGIRFLFCTVLNTKPTCRCLMVWLPYAYVMMISIIYCCRKSQKVIHRKSERYKENNNEKKSIFLGYYYHTYLYF